MTLQSDRANTRPSSIYSTSSASTKNAADTKQEDFSEIVRNQKIKQYKNLVKLDQIQNPSQIAALNSLQDQDLKELTSFLDSYFNICFREINSTDAILSVSINNLMPKDENYIIKLESLQPLEFLRNGIKSGNPLLTCLKPELKIDPSINSTSTLPRINSPKSSIVSFSRFQPPPQPVPVIQPVVNLNYLLVVNLNRDFFRIEQENLNFYKIQAKKRPSNVSVHDFEQIAIAINSKKEQINRINSKKPNYLLPKSIRYLNSRALTDRIIRYFNHVMKNDWPTKPRLGVNTQANSKSQQIEEIDPFLDENRKCFIKNNQIVITFNYNGTKTLKDSKINVHIDLAVKVEDKDDVINTEYVHRSVLEILNQYSKDCELEALDEEKRKRLSTWLVNTFNFNVNLIYLYPTYLHLWSVNTKLVKLNVLKFLIWFDTIRINFTNVTSINDVYLLSPLAFKQNFYQTIQNSQGPLYMFVKLMQLFLTTCFNLLKENPNTASHFENEFYDPDLLLFENEDLLLNLVLNEIKNPGTQWVADNLLDRLWIALTNLRSYLFLTSNLPDPFNRFTNQLPKFYLKCTGYLSLTSTSTSQIFRNKLLNSLNTSFEATMKTVLSKVITEEIDFSTIERSISEMANRKATIVASPVLEKDLNKTSEQFRNEKNMSNAATKGTSQKSDK